MSISDDLIVDVAKILSQKWDHADGRVVPSNTDLPLTGGSRRLDATILYSDLAQSSTLVTDFQQRTAAKVVRCFLSCMCKLITSNGGEVTSFDGDRVMGVFVGDSKNTSATTCALQMNYAVLEIIGPWVKRHFDSAKQTPFEIAHCVGVDTGSVLVVKAGQRGSNDLVWIGRPANLAAKLSDLRELNYHSYITRDVFSRLPHSAKFGGIPERLMWEERRFSFAGESLTVHRSNWTWKP